MLITTVLMLLVTMGMAATTYLVYRTHVDPHVVVYTAQDPSRQQFILLVIHNTGHGVAYNVKFTLDRQLPSRAFYPPREGEARQYAPMTEGPLISGIAALGPDDKRVITWGMYSGLLAAVGQKAPRVTATFEGRGAHPWAPTVHSVESFLDVASFAANDASKTLMGQAVDHLNKIAATTEQIARAATLVSAHHDDGAEAREKESQAAIARAAIEQAVLPKDSRTAAEKRDEGGTA